MARILLNYINGAASDLKLYLQSVGHQVINSKTLYQYNESNRIEEELKADFFLKFVEPESYSGFSLNEIKNEIFSSEIPIIPVIKVTEDSDYSIIRDISASAPYGYLLKNNKTPWDIDELKLTLDVAIHKKNSEKSKHSSSYKTKEALEESEEKFRTLIHQSLDGIVLLDEEGRVIEWNKAHEMITGIKKTDALGREFWEIKQELTPPDLKTPQHLENIKKQQLRALKTGEASFLGKIHETTILRPDGKVYYIEQLAFPIKTYKGYRIGYVTRNITSRKQIEAALEKNIIALSRQLDKDKISFHNLFNLEDIQKIQDLFSEATGVASIITHPDGRPITKPSNFCRLCKDIIRKTDAGLENCYKSDAMIGRSHPEGPIVMPCLSGGLWDAGASITVGGVHIANWLIGQVRNETQNEDQMRVKARELGVDEDEYIEAFKEVPVMSEEQLRKIANVLFTFANQLSDVAYQNAQQASFIKEREDAEKDLEKSLHETQIMNQVVMQLVGRVNTPQIYSITGEAVKELLPNSYIIISVEDSEEKTIRIMECFGMDKFLNKLKNILGIDLYNIRFPVKEMDNEDLVKNRSIVLTEVEDTVYDFVFKKIPKPVFNTLKKLMKIDKIYTVGFSSNGQNFGALTIILPKGQSLEHEQTIETLVYQASIALQRYEAEKTIKESLAEKKVLLREIHHRVKNNMQIISSLLNLQIQYVNEVETLTVLKESQGRVRSMAMIHENLYQSPSLTRIDFKNYIKKLTSNIFYTYGVQNQDIELILDVEDVEMNIETAVPCGLIINELVTNSLKYAFPPSKWNAKGAVTIKLSQEKDDDLELGISDNGIGIPSHIDPRNSPTLGLMLVNNLVKQMEGSLELNRTHGTEFTIKFRELDYKDRI
ncbi:MAG: PocR ligand-binding domain-containing protein [Methanobacteriaceae archaeon]|nr:PocR ligand-binding domain-containing protein [Methanobacteriaceae archaeon]